MYTPAYFKEERVAVLHDAIRRLNFGTLVTTGTEGLEASHIPMLIDPTSGSSGVLRGHVARANPQWQRFNDGAEALAIFTGPNAYITPSWYPTKKQTGKVVPTWNYIAVHVYGALNVFDDADKLLDIVTALTVFHENTRDKPWAVNDAPADFIAAMLKGIVGFELAISRIEGKWKMSQNRTVDDIKGVCEGMERESGQGYAAVAELMAHNSEK